MTEVLGKHYAISFQLEKPFLICDLLGYAPGLLILVHKPTNLFMAYAKPSSLVSMDDEAAARPTLNRLMRKDDCADCARASKAWTVDSEPTPRQRNKAKHGSSASERRIYTSRVEEETLRRVNRHEVCHFEQACCRNTTGRPSRWHKGNPKWDRGSPAEEPR